MERKKILIVDDEKRIRDIFIRLLVESGFIIRQAEDAREAINILIREEMDIVLLDIRMPGIDGKTTFDILHEYNPQQKIIISSVYPLDQQRSIIPNATDYHDKSHGPYILLEKIALTLSRATLAPKTTEGVS